MREEVSPTLTSNRNNTLLRPRRDFFVLVGGSESILLCSLKGRI